MGLYVEYAIHRPGLSVFEGVMDPRLDGLHYYAVLGGNEDIVYIETDNCYSVLVIAYKYIAVSLGRMESYCTNGCGESLVLKSG